MNYQENLNNFNFEETIENEFINFDEKIETSLKTLLEYV